MTKRIIDESGESVDVSIDDDLIEGEVVQDASGVFYEVVSISDDTVRVKLVEVDEDWGE